MIALALAALVVTSPPLLPGRYGAELRITTLTEVPVFGKVTSVTISRALLDLTPRAGTDDTLDALQRPCDVRIEGDAPLGVRMELPPSFLRALHAQSYPIRFQGDVLSASMGTEVVGFDPKVSGGRVPTQAKDPAVLDADLDGAPGATLRLHLPVGVFKLAIASLGEARLDGTVVDANHAQGHVRVLRHEQRILQSDLPLPSELGASLPDPTRSTFRFVALPAAATCGDVLRLAPMAAPRSDGSRTDTR
jgi:hypothetical protein